MTTKETGQKQELVRAKRWAAYAAAGAAGVVGAQAAEANITHVVVGVTLDASTATNFYSANIGTGTATIVFGNLSLGPGNGGFAGFYAGGLNSAGFVGFSSGFKYVSNLASGQNVSALNIIPNNPGYFATMAYGNGYTNSQFLSAGVGYIGFQFDAGAGTAWGWAQVTMLSGTPNNTFSVDEFAYGMPGEQIAVGQTVSAIPLPGSIWLLASGAAGLMGWRKRRQMAVEAA